MNEHQKRSQNTTDYSPLLVTMFGAAIAGGYELNLCQPLQNQINIKYQGSSNNDGKLSGTVVSHQSRPTLFKSKKLADDKKLNIGFIINLRKITISEAMPGDAASGKGFNTTYGQDKSGIARRMVQSKMKPSLYLPNLVYDQNNSPISNNQGIIKNTEQYCIKNGYVRETVQQQHIEFQYNQYGQPYSGKSTITSEVRFTANQEILLDCVDKVIIDNSHLKYPDISHAENYSQIIIFAMDSGKPIVVFNPDFSLSEFNLFNLQAGDYVTNATSSSNGFRITGYHQAGLPITLDVDNNGDVYSTIKAYNVNNKYIGNIFSGKFIKEEVTGYTYIKKVFDNYKGILSKFNCRFQQSYQEPMLHGLSDNSDDHEEDKDDGMIIENYVMLTSAQLEALVDKYCQENNQSQGQAILNIKTIMNRFKLSYESLRPSDQTNTVSSDIQQYKCTFNNITAKIKFQQQLDNLNVHDDSINMHLSDDQWHKLSEKYIQETGNVLANNATVLNHFGVSYKYFTSMAQLRVHAYGSGFICFNNLQEKKILQKQLNQEIHERQINKTGLSIGCLLLLGDLAMSVYSGYECIANKKFNILDTNTILCILGSVIFIIGCGVAIYYCCSRESVAEKAVRHAMQYIEKEYNPLEDINEDLDLYHEDDDCSLIMEHVFNKLNGLEGTHKTEIYEYLKTELNIRRNEQNERIQLQSSN